MTTDCHKENTILHHDSIASDVIPKVFSFGVMVTDSLASIENPHRVVQSY